MCAIFPPRGCWPLIGDCARRGAVARDRQALSQGLAAREEAAGKKRPGKKRPGKNTPSAQRLRRCRKPWSRPTRGECLVRRCVRMPRFADVGRRESLRGGSREFRGKRARLIMAVTRGGGAARSIARRRCELPVGYPPVITRTVVASGHAHRSMSSWSSAADGPRPRISARCGRAVARARTAP